VSTGTVALILNIVWVIFGGLLMAVLWFLAGVLAAITIVGLPWARACFNIAAFSLWPFGREAISRATLTGRGDLGTGPLGLVGNIVWFLVLGIWLALGHLASAIACALTIIGIPFAWQHVKLAGMSLAPIGIAIVDKHIAEEARRRWATGEVDRMRGPRR
jgi:uncharacterized membrane protein YccF (DUF307 family)